jgi:AraC-like DNA-binding protein
MYISITGMPAEREPRIHYLTAPRELSGIGRCVTIGSALTVPGGRYPPDAPRHPHRYRDVSAGGRVLREHQLVYIDAGEGVFEDDDGSHEIASGSVVVIRPGRWHRYYPTPESGWHEYWVGFSGAPLERAVEALGLDRRGSVLPVGQRPELLARFGRLLELARLHDVASHLEMVATVLDLLALASRAADRPSGHVERQDAVHRALASMQDRLSERLSIESLARECGLSPATFRRVFLSSTGSSPYRYFMTLKVNAAKLDLAHTDRTIRDIAERFCFADQFHFCRVFRHYTGISPGEWRRGADATGERSSGTRRDDRAADD